MNSARSQVTSSLGNQDASLDLELRTLRTPPDSRVVPRTPTAPRKKPLRRVDRHNLQPRRLTYVEDVGNIMPQWEQHMGQDSSNIDSGIDLGRTVPFNGDTDKENRPDPATLDPTDSETHDDIIPNSPKKPIEPGSLRFKIDQWMEYVKANLFNQ